MEIENKIFESLGKASLCWDKTPNGTVKGDELLSIGKELLSEFTKLQSDKETLLEALKEARNNLYRFAYENEYEFNSPDIVCKEEALKAVKKYDEAITKATNP